MPDASQEARDKVGALVKLDDILLAAVMGPTSTKIKSIVRDGEKSKPTKRAVGTKAVLELAESSCSQRESINAGVHWLVLRYTSLADPVGYRRIAGFNLQTVIAPSDTEVRLTAATHLSANTRIDQLDSVVLRLWSPSAPKELQLRTSSPNLDWPARGAPYLWIGPQRLLLATVGCEECFNVKFGSNVKDPKLKNDIYKLEAQTVHTAKPIKVGETLRLHPCGTYDSMCPCGKVEEAEDSESDEETEEEELLPRSSVKAKQPDVESSQPTKVAPVAPVLDSSSEEEEAIEWGPTGSQEEEKVLRRTDEEEVASICAPPPDGGDDEARAPKTAKLGKHTLGKRRAEPYALDDAAGSSTKRSRSRDTFMELFDVMRRGYHNLMHHLDDVEEADAGAYQDHKATVISWFRRQADHLENEAPLVAEDSAALKRKSRQSFTSMERRLEEHDRAIEAMFKSKSSSRSRVGDAEERGL